MVLYVSALSRNVESVSEIFRVKIITCITSWDRQIALYSGDIIQVSIGCLLSSHNPSMTLTLTWLPVCRGHVRPNCYSTQIIPILMRYVGLSWSYHPTFGPMCWGRCHPVVCRSNLDVIWLAFWCWLPVLHLYTVGPRTTKVGLVWRVCDNLSI